MGEWAFGVMAIVAGVRLASQYRTIRRLWTENDYLRATLRKERDAAPMQPLCVHGPVCYSLDWPRGQAILGHDPATVN